MLLTDWWRHTGDSTHRPINASGLSCSCLIGGDIQVPVLIDQSTPRACKCSYLIGGYIQVTAQHSLPRASTSNCSYLIGGDRTGWGLTRRGCKQIYKEHKFQITFFYTHDFYDKGLPEDWASLGWQSSSQWDS